MPRELTPQEEINRDFNQAQTEVGSPLKTLKGTPIKRYKGLVGKEVAGQVYLHKNYVETLLTSGKYPDRMISIANYEEALEHIGDTPFNCVMLDHKKRRIRFDEAPDFDTAREPIAGNMTYYDIRSRSIVMTDYSGQIWHHKWMWVMNDYTGFDVRESWEWSKTYLSVLRDTGEPQANRGIANGMGQGGKLWRDQLRYFGLEEEKSVGDKIRSSLHLVKETIAEKVKELRAEAEADPRVMVPQVDEDFFDYVINHLESLYQEYNSGKISNAQLEEKAKEEMKELIFQFNQETYPNKDILEDIIRYFDEDLLEVYIDLELDIYKMTIKEAETVMDEGQYTVSLSGESKKGYNGPYGYAYIEHETLGNFFVSVGAMSAGYKSLKLHPYTNYPWVNLDKLSSAQIKFIEDNARDIMLTLFPKAFSKGVPDKLVYNEEDEKKDAKWMWNDKWNLQEVEKPMDGNRPFDQALELMDKFDYALMDYDEGAMSKETISQKFSTLQYKIEQLKKGCGIEDRTFLNEKMKQFKEILNYYKIPLEECNESEEIKETRDSVTVRGKSYPVKDKSYLDGKLAGYGNDTGLESIMTVKYKNGDRYTIYDSGIGNMGSSYACAVKVEECNESNEVKTPLQSWLEEKGLTGEWERAIKAMDYQAITDLLVMFNNPKENYFESKKITEAEAHQFQVKDISLEGDELRIPCYDTKYDEDFDKYLVACKKSIRLLLKDPAFDIPDHLISKCKDLMNSLEESKKITESSQSPMIFKVGNVYRLTPNDSYAYDRVEILGIDWNDMVGQCSIQYRVVMKDGSVEEGQSEAGDLISTIKKNNEDRVEFYKTEVPQMNESETLTEASSDIAFMIVDAIEGTIKECIDSGEGHYSRDDLSVTAAWADDEDSIDIVIRSEGRSIHYVEPGVASRMGW